MNINEKMITEEMMTEEIIEKLTTEVIKSHNEMIERGELIICVDSEGIRNMVNKMFKERARRKILVTAGLGLAVYAGYAIFKTFAKRKGTQSEVIVEGEE